MSAGNGATTLERVLELLPHAIYLPIQRGNKGPIYRWRKITLAQSRRPRYRRWLKERPNTGIVLGSPSGGLCAVDIDDDQLVQEFVNLNPDLAGTLCSKGARGAQFWLQMVGDYPHSVHKLKTENGRNWGEWRADGGQSIIRGIHPSGCRYHLLCDAPPIRIRFEEIHWPQSLIQPWIVPPSPPLPKAEESGNHARTNCRPAGIDLAERIRRYVAKLPASVSGNGGDDQLFKAASVLVNGFSLSPEEALPFLREYNGRAEPPWSENRLVYKLQEALKHLPEGKRPGYLLEDGRRVPTRAAIKEPESVADPIGNQDAQRGRNGNSEQPLVRIRLPGCRRLESKFATEVGQVLGHLGVVFRNDDRVVEIQEEEFSGELDRFKLARGGLKFNTLMPARARTSFEQYIEPGIDVELKQGSGITEFVARTMSEQSARSLLVSPQFLKHIPRIARILDVPIPIRKPNGEIVFPKFGFNPSLGIYCAPGALEIKQMSLEEAVKVIEQALAGFCWEIPQSKVHAIARMITPYARGVMGFSERTPLWYFVGNRPRCGKDYLSGITQIVYLGHAFEDAPITDNYEETSKRIVSALRAGRRMMHFANCQHHLNDPGFIQSITAPTINARSLGSNDAKSDLELPNEIDYSLSANVGLTYREDVEPRLRKIDLAFFEEDANKRTFPNPFLHDWIKANRSQVLSAIHSLFQYWISKGAPAGKTLFNSFPRWAEVVGGVMVTCGLGDPCLAHEGEDLLGGDLREIAMKALFQVAFDTFPEQWLRKGDIYDIIREQRENNDRLSWFGELDGDSKEKSFATKRVGNALSGFRNRILGGVKLEIDTSNAKSQQWRYRFRKVL